MWVALEAEELGSWSRGPEEKLTEFAQCMSTALDADTAYGEKKNEERFVESHKIKMRDERETRLNAKTIFYLSEVFGNTCATST